MKELKNIILSGLTFLTISGCAGNKIKIPEETSVNDKPEIIELERISQDHELLCKIPYENPEKDKRVFYDWVEEYAKSQGIEIQEEKTSLITDSFLHLKTIKGGFEGRYGDTSTDARLIFQGTMGLLLEPVLYPLLGGQPAMTAGYTGKTKVYNPIWEGLPGLISGSGKTHEYMHVYQISLVNDLFKRGLVNRDEYFRKNFFPGEPYVNRKKAPTKEELNGLENMTLRRLIRFESSRKK